MRSNQKIFYIDNLKVGLITLVVLHHALITYGAAGDWYYTQKTTLPGAIVPMTVVVILDQSFFMGFFFFLSAYFIPGSFDRKGMGRFLRDRLVRLGIPLVFYSFILSPVLIYLVTRFGEGRRISFVEFLGGFHDWIDFGVLWFVAALLLFTMFYCGWRALRGRTVSAGAAGKLAAAPSTGRIFLFAAVVGVVSFFVRVIFPIGWKLNPVGFQLAHFAQYVALFSLGIVAVQNKWLDTFPFDRGKKFARYAARLLLFLPVVAVIQKFDNTPDAWFDGGWHWQQLLYAVWEQLIGFPIIVALLAFGKKLWNKSSPLMGRLSRNAFAVYIFHPLVLVGLALILRDWGVGPALKLLVVAPLAVAGTFLLASVITAIPGVRRIV